MTDIPLSYPVIDVHLHDVRLNQSELIWDPTKETGVYIRVHCISTEFTAKKHGGEKGVPFRIQVETYSQGEDSKLLHCASCQVKVFKPKGTDRKHKTDREKMEKRSEAEKVPLAQVLAAQAQQLLKSPTSISTTVCPISPVHSRIPESTTPQSPLPTSPASPPTPSHISTRVTTPQTVTADVDPIAGIGWTRESTKARAMGYSHIQPHPPWSCTHWVAIFCCRSVTLNI